MNKRGQVYFLAVLILGMVLFGLTRMNSVIDLGFLDDDFERLSENYKRESALFLSRLEEDKLHGSIQTDQLVEKFAEFTSEFSSYSKTENPEFGLIYFYDVGDSLYVGNFLDQQVAVYINTVDNVIAVDGCKSKIRAGASFDGFGGTIGIGFSDLDRCIHTFTGIPQDYKVNVVIGEFEYSVDLIMNVPEMIIVNQEFKDEQRKVVLSESFIDGKKIDLAQFCSNPGLSGPPLATMCQ